MLFSPSITTLIAYQLYAAFALAIGLFAWRTFPKEGAAYTLPCAIGFILAAPSAFFMGIGAYLQSKLVIVLGELFVPLSWIFIYYSFANLLGAKASLRTIFNKAMIALALVITIFFLRYIFSTEFHSQLFSSDHIVASILFNSVIAFMCLRVYKSYQLSIAAILALLHVLYLTVLVARLGLNISNGFGGDSNSSLFTPIFSSILFVISLAKFLGIFSLFSLIKASTDQKLMTENYLIKEEVANKKIEKSEVQFLASLNALAKARDNETGNHIIRTQNYVKLLAKRLRADGHYVESLSDKSINLLFKAAPLHDIGKVGIPDNILLKNGSLTEAEWVVMKTHTTIGETVLDAEEVNRDGDADLVGIAIKIAGGHHEKWDGSGYPRGLVGQAIPLEARIMSLADMYDALVSKRVYKKAWTHEEAVQEIVSKREIQFDPLIVDAFLAEQNAFREIAHQYRDH